MRKNQDRSGRPRWLLSRIALSLGLALMAGAAGGGCHRQLGPQVLHAQRPRPTWTPAPAMSAGHDKGRPRFAVGWPVPPALGSTPSTGDVAVAAPYRNDGARIERSMTTGVSGTDHGP